VLAFVEMVRLHCDHLNRSRPDGGWNGTRLDVVAGVSPEGGGETTSAGRRPTGAAIIEFFFVVLASEI